MYYFEHTKGQLISKCIFGVFNFLQTKDENKSHSSKIEYVRLLFGGNVDLKKSFRFCLTFRIIYSNSKRSEQVLVTECFFNLFMEVSHI